MARDAQSTQVSFRIDGANPQLFELSHHKTELFRSYVSELSYALHTFSGKGSHDGDKTVYDNLMSVIPTLKEFKFRFEPDVSQLPPSPTFRHFPVHYSLKYNPSSGDLYVQLVTMPLAQKMFLDTRNRSHEPEDGAASTIVKNIAQSYGLNPIRVLPSAPILEWGRVIQSNLTDWSFIVSQLIWRTGVGPTQSGYQVFSTVGNELYFGPLSYFAASNEFRPKSTTVSEVYESCDALVSMRLGGSTLQSVGFDHYEKKPIGDVQSSGSPSYGNQDPIISGSRMTYFPARSGTALGAYTIAQQRWHHYRAFFSQVDLSGIAPGDLSFPMLLNLVETNYRESKNQKMLIAASHETLKNGLYTAKLYGMRDKAMT